MKVSRINIYETFRRVTTIFIFIYIYNHTACYERVYYINNNINRIQINYSVALEFIALHKTKTVLRKRILPVFVLV